MELTAFLIAEAKAGVALCGVVIGAITLARIRRAEAALRYQRRYDPGGAADGARLTRIIRRELILNFALGGFGPLVASWFLFANARGLVIDPTVGSAVVVETLYLALVGYAIHLFGVLCAERAL